MEVLAERLLHAFPRTPRRGWPWPEDVVTYDNGKIPHALLLAGHSLKRDDMIECGLRALGWLVDLQTENGFLRARSAATAGTCATARGPGSTSNPWKRTP